MGSKAIVPFSGGMDSTTILYHAIQKHDTVYAVAINYGQRHLQKELAAGREIINDLYNDNKNKINYSVLDLSFFKQIVNVSSLTNNNIKVAKAKDVMGDPQTVNYVPFRNMMMLSICSALAESVGADTVYHGAAQADSVAGYWDGSKEFIDAMNNVTILNRRNKIKIEAPLLDKSKADIIKWGMSMNVPYDKTWTCYEGLEKACGTCTSCSLRLKGFIEAGLKDPVAYSVPIPWNYLLKDGLV